MPSIIAALHILHVFCNHTLIHKPKNKKNTMKTRRNRVLPPTLMLLLLSGCASVQNHPLYSAWQERAYSAYGMPVPAPTQNPYMNTTMPYQFSNRYGLGLRLQRGYTGRTFTVSDTPRLSSGEQQYIAQYYALR